MTKFVEGSPAEKSESTLNNYGEILGRLSTLPEGTGAVLREAGALHHYSLGEGRPRNELHAAASWLDEVEDKVPAKNRNMHNSLREQVARADDCHDLPEALIHPDAVLKNMIASPDGPILIDWTGAGRGPRLMSLALLLWVGSLNKGGWDPSQVDTIVAGYSSHVHLQENELVRIGGAMRIRPLVFACWRYRYAMIAGKPPDGSEWWWPSDELVDAISARASIAFEKKI